MGKKNPTLCHYFINQKHPLLTSICGITFDVNEMRGNTKKQLDKVNEIYNGWIYFNIYSCKQCVIKLNEIEGKEINKIDHWDRDNTKEKKIWAKLNKIDQKEYDILDKFCEQCDNYYKDLKVCYKCKIQQLYRFMQSQK